jgi:hypothetical protein
VVHATGIYRALPTEGFQAPLMPALERATVIPIR